MKNSILMVIVLFGLPTLAQAGSYDCTLSVTTSSGKEDTAKFEISEGGKSTQILRKIGKFARLELGVEPNSTAYVLMGPIGNENFVDAYMGGVVSFTKNKFQIQSGTDSIYCNLVCHSK